MTERISIGQLYPRAAPPASVGRMPAGSSAAESGARTFHEVLQERFVRISQHAEQRLKQRGIDLQPEQLAKIETAIEKSGIQGSEGFSDADG